MGSSEKIRFIIEKLPRNPGVYQFLDNRDVILYIGKAKNIKSRVASYFIKNSNKKIGLLISKIADIKYLVVQTEMDALLLENNLIKKYQPKYNVMLKDDKTYPFICVKNESFPRVFLTRNVVKDGSTYIGPYTSVKLVKTLIEFIHQIYPVRTCNLNLSKNNISKNKFQVCLEYHIGNCLGPCEGLQSEDDYDISISHIKKILKGDIKSVSSSFRRKMDEYSKMLDFERAQEMKDKIKLLENYQAKSTIVNPRINNVDVFSIVSDKDSAFVNYLRVSSGAIVQMQTIHIKKKLDETDSHILVYAITEIRTRFNSTSKYIYSSIKLDNLWEGAKVIVPKIGDKYKLVQLSIRNAKYMHVDFITRRGSLKERSSNLRVLKRIQKDIGLKSIPTHIECFDNSNLQGTHPVSACVVFRNGKPSKKDYRHFNIQTVDGIDDCSSMEEVVYRRYQRLLKQKESLPQLIVIDGGKGQLSSAIKSLKRLSLLSTIQVISIAKRLEEIFIPGEDIPLYLDKRSETLKLIQYIRNEAHRFGLSHHRNKRLRGMLNISLESIEGIGPRTVEILLSHFGSVNNIRSANKKDIISLVGNKKGKKIIIYLQKNSL